MNGRLNTICTITIRTFQNASSTILFKNYLSTIVCLILFRVLINILDDA